VIEVDLPIAEHCVEVWVTGSRSRCRFFSLSAERVQSSSGSSIRTCRIVVIAFSLPLNTVITFSQHLQNGSDEANMRPAAPACPRGTFQHSVTELRSKSHFRDKIDSSLTLTKLSCDRSGFKWDKTTPDSHC